MAEGTIQGNRGVVLVEKRTLLTGGSSTTWYANYTFDISKEGYMPVCLMPQANQARLHFYKASIVNGNNAEIGIARPDTSNTIDSLTIIAVITYVRNDFI